MKCCLIHEMLGCIYAHIVLEVRLRDLDKSFHILYLYIENLQPSVKNHIRTIHINSKLT